MAEEKKVKDILKSALGGFKEMEPTSPKISELYLEDMDNETKFGELGRLFVGANAILKSERGDFQKILMRLKKPYYHYGGFLKSRVSTVGDAMFLIGMIENVAKVVENHWGRKLMGSELADKLPAAFPFLARSEGLVGKINGLINKFSESGNEKELKEGVNAVLERDPSIPKGVTVDNLMKNYEELTGTQPGWGLWAYKYGGQGIYLKKAEDILKNITVLPATDKKSMDVGYQIERLGRRMWSVKGTDIVNEAGYKFFKDLLKAVGVKVDEKDEKIRIDEEGGMLKPEVGSPEGRALIAQALNIQFSDIARNWMRGKIQKIKEKLPEDFEYSGDFLSDLENFANSISHVGRREKQVKEMTDIIDDFLEKDSPSRGQVYALWDGLNRKLTTSKYESHSGEMVTFSPMAALPLNYEGELWFRDKRMDKDRIKSIVREYTKRAEKEDIKSLAREAIRSQDYGLAEADVIVRRFVDGLREKMRTEFDREIEEGFKRRNELKQTERAAGKEPGAVGVFPGLLGKSALNREIERVIKDNEGWQKVIDHVGTVSPKARKKAIKSLIKGIAQSDDYDWKTMFGMVHTLLDRQDIDKKDFAEVVKEGSKYKLMRERVLKKEAKSIVDDYLKGVKEPKEEDFRSMLRERKLFEGYGLASIDAINREIVKRAYERIMTPFEREVSRAFRDEISQMDDRKNMLLIAGLTGEHGPEFRERLAEKFGEPAFERLPKGAVSASELLNIETVRNMAARIMGRPVGEEDIKSIISNACSVRAVLAAAEAENGREEASDEFRSKIRRGLENSGPFRRILKQMIDRRHLPAPEIKEVR